jgi:hypothetical protein
MITNTRKGNRIGVNRNGQPVGYAVRTNRTKQPEQWTAFVYTELPPFDVARPGFTNADAVVAFIGEHGRTPDHLKR